MTDKIIRLLVSSVCHTLCALVLSYNWLRERAVRS